MVEKYCYTLSWSEYPCRMYFTAKCYSDSPDLDSKWIWENMKIVDVEIADYTNDFVRDCDIDDLIIEEVEEVDD